MVMLSEARAADGRVRLLRPGLLRFIPAAPFASGVIRRPRRITPALCDAPKPRGLPARIPAVSYHQIKQADRSGGGSEANGPADHRRLDEIACLVVTETRRRRIAPS